MYIDYNSTKYKINDGSNLVIDKLHKNHFRRQIERPIKKNEKGKTTLLFGGLTWKHEKLLKGLFEGLGYKCDILPNPDLSSLQIGKEYCDPGCCNPTYFTGGALIQYLKKLEENGLDKEYIINNYAFFTAGSYGPCRFGMYEAQYRLALRNAGYEGFRVIIFQQYDGIDQSNKDYGLDMDLDFFIGILMCFIIGDIVNDLAYQIRPYEIISGSTNIAVEKSIQEAYSILSRTKFPNLPNFVNKKFIRKIKLNQFFKTVIKIYQHFTLNEYKTIIRIIKNNFSTLKVDYSRNKPIIKITGEFWAQTTESEGNYNLHSFLEKKNAQVFPEHIGNWILYISHQNRIRIVEKIKSNLFHKNFNLKILLSNIFSVILLKLGEFLFIKKFNSFSKSFNNKTNKYIPQDRLRKISEKYYHPFIEGGEGHQEIGKIIYYSKKKLCHMFVSVKPFGCMPSLQSESIISSINSKKNDILYCPIETSGEGTINAYSRILLTLNDSKKSQQNELLLIGNKNIIYHLNKILRKLLNANLENPFLKIPLDSKLISISARFRKRYL